MNVRGLYRFKDYFDDQLFCTGLFQTNQYAAVQASLRNDSLLLELGINLLNAKQFTNCKSESPSEHLPVTLLEYLNYANSALSLGGMHHVYVDSLRALIKRLKAKKAA